MERDAAQRDHAKIMVITAKIINKVMTDDDSGQLFCQIILDMFKPQEHFVVLGT